MEWWMVLVIPIAIVVGLYIVVFIIKNFMYICKPNEILIFSGSSGRSADGSKTGFRVVTGGRAFRIPILEQVHRMDRTLISVPMRVEGAYSEGGIPLAMRAVANVKISSDPRYVQNAIERFLGRDQEELARVAKETLEGHLRGVLADMTPEEVNEDRLKFAAKLAEEAEDDLHKLGLHLDTLKIQHVSDEVNYLESTGRERIAIILKEAAVAESDAARAASEAEARARGQGEVARRQAQAKIQQKANQLRQIRAELDARARSEEERAEAAAQAARAAAEQELQAIRAELEQLRLSADVVIPAEMERRAREIEASGEAAPILENGRAMAESLSMVAGAWRESGDEAMSMFVMQRIDTILEQIASATRELAVGQVSLIDSELGRGLPQYVSAYPAVVGSVLKEIFATVGVDLKTAIGGTSTEGSADIVTTASGKSDGQQA